MPLDVLIVWHFYVIWLGMGAMVKFAFSYELTRRLIRYPAHLESTLLVVSSL